MYKQYKTPSTVSWFCSCMACANLEGNLALKEIQFRFCTIYETRRAFERKLHETKTTDVPSQVLIRVRNIFFSFLAVFKQVWQSNRETTEDSLGEWRVSSLRFVGILRFRPQAPGHRAEIVSDGNRYLDAVFADAASRAAILIDV